MVHPFPAPALFEGVWKSFTVSRWGPPEGRTNLYPTIDEFKGCLSCRERVCDANEGRKIPQQAYEEVLQLTTSPELLALAHANGGYAYLALKQYEQAKQDFEVALQEQPGNAAATLGIGLLAQTAVEGEQPAHYSEHAIKYSRRP